MFILAVLGLVAIQPFSSLCVQASHCGFSLWSLGFSAQQASVAVAPGL